MLSYLGEIKNQSINQSINQSLCGSLLKPKHTCTAYAFFSPISQNIKEIFAKLAKDDKLNVRFISDDHKQLCDIFIS